jgi:hypothetical protein
MSLEALKDRLPEYAKDIRLNLGTLASEQVLNEKQKAARSLPRRSARAMPAWRRP